jgi:hypothetical protein
VAASQLLGVSRVRSTVYPHWLCAAVWAVGSAVAGGRFFTGPPLRNGPGWNLGTFTLIPRNRARRETLDGTRIGTAAKLAPVPITQTYAPPKGH